MSAGCFASLLLAASAVATGGRTDAVAGRRHGTPLEPATPIAQLVESMPTGLEEALPRLDGIGDTSSAQIALLDAAQQTIDVTVMYWNLLASPSSVDPAKRHQLGADRGAKLYAAFEAAAARGVNIRILQCRGVSLCSDAEATQLQSKFPEQVRLRYWNATDWYDGGIMHQKLWICDQSHVYLGSANMDWLSLTQVKELGVVVQHSPIIGADATELFEHWWAWAQLPSRSTSPAGAPALESVFVPSLQQNITVPCWSAAVAETKRCANPLHGAEGLPPKTPHNSSTPMQLRLNDSEAAVFLSGSPPEILADGGAASYGKQRSDQLHQPSRTWDQDALVDTILNASIGGSVSLSVMDYLPSSLYSPPQAAVWWPALNDALITAAVSKGSVVRVLISKWAHTNARIAPALAALQAAASSICSAPHAPAYLPKCGPGGTGSLEVRLFEVPGWNQTEGANAAYPPYSRVNHAKYIVTDNRLNVGTSNMAWGYFWNTAGTSFNTNHPGLREAAQKIFDRDWASDLSRPLLA